MQKITAYFVDARGVFTHSVDLDFYGSQPAGAIYDTPPESVDGHTRLWRGGVWVQVPDAQVPEMPEVENLSEPVPQSVARAQGKAALITAGLWPGVLAFVSEIPDPTERALAEVALHDTQQWQRNSPFLNAAKDGLGLTDEQLDELFVAAAGIEL